MRLLGLAGHDLHTHVYTCLLRESFNNDVTYASITGLSFLSAAPQLTLIQSTRDRSS